jgi:hypothetical protein
MKRRNFFIVLWVLAWAWLGGPPAGAMILFGLDNSANQTDPGTGVPFSSVGLVTNAGQANPMGSAIHLGGGYMLTANHVIMQPYVTFDGVTYYERDLGFLPTQVAANVDMKVFRLTSTPIVAAVNLYTGASEEVAAATQVGWGVGRNPATPITTLVVPWGDYSTIDKRWGVNELLDAPTISYDSYTYDGLRTVLGSESGSPAGLGASEAALTLIDSGSGMFQEIGGVWYLIGLGTSVETNNSSTFGDDAVDGAGAGNENYFVRVGSYASGIQGLVPEPSAGLLLAGGLWVLLARRRVARH